MVRQNIMAEVIQLMVEKQRGEAQGHPNNMP
jgi:hypothetical protein